MALQNHQQLLHSFIPIPAPLNLKMFVGTWNVGGKAPNGGLDLTEWLRRTRNSTSPPHIYVLGFQEIVPLNARNVFGPEDKVASATWLSLIREALNPSNQNALMSPENYTHATPNPTGPNRTKTSFLDLLSTNGLAHQWSTDTVTARDGDRYCLAESAQMVGIFTCVWIRSGLMKHVTNIRSSCVGTGIMGYLGNKGAVSMSMTLQGSTFCFVCTHLASGEKEGDKMERNSDVVRILRRTKFARSRRFYGPATILEHSKIVWFGDLNYRLAHGWGTDTFDLVKKKDWQALLERDQLRMQQKIGRVLSGWEEGSITFSPTYKYVANSDRYVVNTAKSGEKRRTPAWCDRILWKGTGMKQIVYAREELRFSDHRPVYSLFSIDIDSDDYRSHKGATRTESSNGSTCSRVQAEELLLLTRTQSCIQILR